MMEAVASPRLSGDRIERAVYVARNDRGAEVRLGDGDRDGVFSPGELLEIAVAACGFLSADHALSSRLGEDFNASFTVAGKGVRGENRYEQFDAELVVDMSELERDRHEALIKRAIGVIGRLCSVGRTVNHGAPTNFVITPDSA